MATTGPTDNGAHRELLEFARTQARTTINEARQAVWNLRHEEENDVDVIAAIEGVAAQTRREFGTEIAFAPNVREFAMGASAAHEILMTVREAVYNSVQHSGKNKVQVQVEVAGADLTIAIVDGGVGFVPSAGWAPEGHYGLVGMQERVQRLGGRFELTSAPGRGTTVKLAVRRTSRHAHAE